MMELEIKLNVIVIPKAPFTSLERDGLACGTTAEQERDLRSWIDCPKAYCGPLRKVTTGVGVDGTGERHQMRRERGREAWTSCGTAT